MMGGLVAALAVVLFGLVAGLLVHGVRAFGHANAQEVVETRTGRRFEMGREVLWTASASALLLTIFALVR